MSLETFAIHMDHGPYRFSAIHCLVFNNQQREALHGHDFSMSLHLEVAKLDQNQLAFDFLKIDPLLKEIITKLNHKILLPLKNPQISIKEEQHNIVIYLPQDLEIKIPAREAVLMTTDNVSTEFLAQYLGQEVLASLEHDKRITRIKVELEEAPQQKASWEKAMRIL